MSLPVSKPEPLSTLDYVFTVLSNRKTHLDFALVVHLPKPPSVEALEIGAASARNKYPITNSFVYRRRWEYLSTNGSAIEVRTNATSTALEQFMDAPFDLKLRHLVDNYSLSRIQAVRFSRRVYITLLRMGSAPQCGLVTNYR